MPKKFPIEFGYEPLGLGPVRLVAEPQLLVQPGEIQQQRVPAWGP